ncbi:unnamed protein product [Ixodes pacificus]
MLTVKEVYLHYSILYAPAKNLHHLPCEAAPYCLKTGGFGAFP